jgi:hypothetical protein
MGVEPHAHAALPPGQKGPLYPLDKKLGRPQRRSGRCGVGNEVAAACIGTPALQPIATLTEHTEWDGRHMVTNSVAFSLQAIYTD